MYMFTPPKTCLAAKCFGAIIRIRFPLADDRVRCLADVVAVVAADTMEIAKEASKMHFCSL